MKYQKEKPVTSITGSPNRINQLSITQFNLAEFYRDGNEFQRKTLELIGDEIPYQCIYCRENFTGFGVWVLFSDSMNDRINIHLSFSCRTCWQEIHTAKERKAAKIKARGLRNLFSIIKNSEVKK